MVTQSARLSQALSDASKNAQNAIDASLSPSYSDTPLDEKEAWAMAAILHLDMTRLIVAIEQCSEPLAKLLMISDAVSKLFEAYTWYTKHGSPALQVIAGRRRSGKVAAQAEIGRILKHHKIDKIKNYQPYRNKISHHYDGEFLLYLDKIGKEKAEDFYLILTSFLLFSKDWANLTRSLIQEPKADTRHVAT